MVLFEDDDDDVNRGIAVVAPESKSRGIQDRYYTIILACTLFGLVMLQRHGIIRNNNEASVRHPLAVRQSTGTRTTPHKHDGGIRYLSFGSYGTFPVTVASWCRVSCIMFCFCVIVPMVMFGVPSFSHWLCRKTTSTIAYRHVGIGVRRLSSGLSVFVITRCSQRGCPNGRTVHRSGLCTDHDRRNR